MYLKKTKLIALIIMLSAAEVAAQSITGSPYSRYGIGDICFPGTGHNIAMGGTSAAESNSLYVNTVNPACNTNLQLQRFVFDVGLDVRYTDTKSASESEKTCKSTFRYLTGGFAAKPWWYFAFALKPYCSTGYSAKYTDNSEKFEGKQYPYTYSYKGTGGLNKVSIATAFKFLKMFSVGFTGSVLFGSIEHAQSTAMSRDGFIIHGQEYPYSSFYYMNDKRVMHGVQGDIGFRFEKRFASAKDSLRDALRISIGAYINGKANLKARNEIFVNNQHTYYSYWYNSSTYYTARTDTIANDTISSEKVKLPKGFGIGASVELAERLTINADFNTQKWGDFKLPNDVVKKHVRDSKYFGLGLQYVNAQYSSKYYRKIIYRIGTYTQQTYLDFDGQGIDDKGVTFGFGFPIRGQLLLNINFQLGKRGTSQHGLYEEKYFLVHFNATLHDVWFVKRKFQ